MADTPLPWPLMQAMLLELVRAERVPFEADPLTGLQVLGMLETRLLRFSRVFLVDVTDDRLPGARSAARSCRTACAPFSACQTPATANSSARTAWRKSRIRRPSVPCAIHTDPGRTCP